MAWVVAGFVGALLAGSVPAYAASYTETQLTNNTIADRYPLLANSGDVFWMGYSGVSGGGDDFEIFHFDGSSTTQLTDNGVDDLALRINEVGQAVWVSQDLSSADPADYVSELVRFDGSGVTGVSGSDFVWASGGINDSGHATWIASADLDITQSHVFYFDGTTTQQITTTAGFYGSLDINNDGAVVWDRHDGSDWEIMYFDGLSITQLTDNAVNDISPRIGNDGTVVWMRNDGSDFELMRYKAGVIQQLTDNAVDDVVTRAPNNSGQFFFYRGNVSPNVDLMFYDGTSVQTVATAVGDDDTATPSLNNFGQLAYALDDGTDLELFVWDGSASTQVTDNDVDDFRSSINDNGALAWQRERGASAEIILAVAETARTVVIDVRPGNPVNPVNLRTEGTVPVAIMSDAEFDATTVLPATIRLAGAPVRTPGRSGAYQCREQDVNADDLPDLVCNIDVSQMVLDPDAVSVILVAQTAGGDEIQGEAPIHIVGGG